jgi:hypothetical protein
MSRAFAGNPPLIHAAGHEHNLQLLRGVGGAKYQVISGAGIFNHSTPTRAIAGTLYARRASGWTTVAFLRDGRVRIAYRTVDAEGRITEEFSMWLDVPPIVRPPSPPAPADSLAPAAPAPTNPTPLPASVPPSAPPPGTRP